MTTEDLLQAGQVVKDRWKVVSDGFEIQNEHYENMPMQYTEKKIVVKMKIFTGNFFIFFLFLLKT